MRGDDGICGVFERDRGFADSPLEGDGFEPSVPRQIRSHFRYSNPVFHDVLTVSRPETGSSNPSPSQQRVACEPDFDRGWQDASGGALPTSFAPRTSLTASQEQGYRSVFRDFEPAQGIRDREHIAGRRRRADHGQGHRLHDQASDASALQKIHITLNSTRSVRRDGATSRAGLRLVREVAKQAHEETRSG
jgi:hypothetical protein